LERKQASSPIEICIVTVDSDEELQELVTAFARRFESDYDGQGIESGQATVLNGRSNEDQVHVLLPAVDGSRYVGALGFDLGVDHWSFIWAYLESEARHLGLIEAALGISAMRVSMISHGAAVIVCDTPVSPAGRVCSEIEVPVTGR
jgi:hypothetical protein